MPGIAKPLPEDVQHIPGLADWLETKEGANAREKIKERGYVPWEVAGPFLWKWYQAQSSNESRFAALEREVAQIRLLLEAERAARS